MANPTDSTVPAANDNGDSNKKKKRQICPRCQRPVPRACICEALPERPLPLLTTSLVVLQHPLELKHKNRSLPVLEMCLESEHVNFCVGRRLGDQIDPKVLQLLQQPNIPILIYPEEEPLEDFKGGENPPSEDPTGTMTHPISLSQAKVELSKRMQESDLTKRDEGSKPKVVVFLLDATWKYAREMHRANQQHGQYPPHMLQVSIQPGDLPADFQPRRFDIRTTPSPKPNTKNSLREEESDNQAWMSTAECAAFVLSELEEALAPPKKDVPNVHSAVMKPLDLMVQKWNSFMSEPKKRRQNKSDNSATNKKRPRQG